MKIALKFSRKRNGERIEFDQPWEETPNREDFVMWLTNIRNEFVLTGLQVRLADLKEFVGNIWYRGEKLRGEVFLQELLAGSKV